MKITSFGKGKRLASAAFAAVSVAVLVSGLSSAQALAAPARINLVGDDSVLYIEDIAGFNPDKKYANYTYTSSDSNIVQANPKYDEVIAMRLGDVTITIQGEKCDGSCGDVVYYPDSFDGDEFDLDYGKGTFFTYGGEIYKGPDIPDWSRDSKWTYDEESGKCYGWVEVSEAEALANYVPNPWFIKPDVPNPDHKMIVPNGYYALVYGYLGNRCYQAVDIMDVQMFNEGGGKAEVKGYLKLVPLETHRGDSMYKVRKCSKHDRYGLPTEPTYETTEIKVKTYAACASKQCGHLFIDKKYSVRTLTSSKTIQTTGKFLKGSGYSVSGSGKYINFSKTGKKTVKYKIGKTVYNIKVDSVHSKDELISETIKKIKRNALVPSSVSIQKTTLKENGTLVVRFTAINRYGVRVSQTAQGWYEGDKVYFYW